MPLVRCLFAVAVAAATQACAGEANVRTELARDSAGVHIIEQDAPVGAWSIGEPILTIGNGTGDPDHDLHRVVGATRLHDGSLLLGNAATGELRKYTPNGDLVRSVGRIGEGPNEFGAMSWFGRMGDSVRVWDRGTNRVSVFDLDLQPGRKYAISLLPETPLSLEVRGALSTGELLLARGPDFVPTVAGENDGEQRHPLSAYLVSPSGELVQEFGPFPGFAVVTRRPVPFGRATLIAAGGAHVYEGDNAAYDVRAFDSSGELRLILRRPHQQVPVRPTDVELWIEASLDGVPPAAVERARALLRAVPTPQLMPPIRRMVADSEGRLWVRAAGPLDETEAAWSVFTHHDGWLADIKLPGSMEVLDAGRDWLLVRDNDEFGVELVRVLPLGRP